MGHDLGVGTTPDTAESVVATDRRFQTPSKPHEHIRNLLAAEYCRCDALVKNCDDEIDKSMRAIEEWKKERLKWSERRDAIVAEFGGEPVPPPPRAQSELTDAWEFDVR